MEPRCSSGDHHHSALPSGNLRVQALTHLPHGQTSAMRSREAVALIALLASCPGVVSQVSVRGHWEGTQPLRCSV